MVEASGKAARARRIRVANAPYLGTNPYRLLSELDFIEYQENLPSENARKLHEGLVDIALIPASDFGAHGGYVGLDYGLACRRRSHSVILAARCRPQKLTRVYLYEGAATSVQLLRLLLKERWKNSPLLVRDARVKPHELGDTEGMLVLDDGMESDHKTLPVQEDLVAAWDRLTSKPFTFLIWALRPGVLSLKQLQLFHEQLGRSSSIVEPLIRDAAEAQGVPVERSQRFWSECYSYYFDETIVQGVDLFFKKASDQRIMPVCQYRSATFTLFEKRSFGALKERPIATILQGIIDGERLGVQNAIRIAEQTSLSDLGMTADLVRSRLFPERSLSEALFLDPHEDGHVLSHLEQASKKGVWHVVLMPAVLQSLQSYLDLISRIRAAGPYWIEAFTLSQLHQLAEQTGTTMNDIVSRLVTAGLNSISGYGAGMLTSVGLKRRKSKYSQESWTDTIRTIHRSGASMHALLSLHPKESWQDRISHLLVLRTLQEEHPGFHSCRIEFAPQAASGLKDPEERLRAVALARLFLDNVSTIAESRIHEEPLTASLSLSFGANQIFIPHGPNSLHVSEVSVETLRRLGIEVSTLVLKSDSEGPLQ